MPGEHFDRLKEGAGLPGRGEVLVLLLKPVAERGAEVLYVEAKGRTAAFLGLDVDTLYGQLLRRMPIADESISRFAVVVPSSVIAAATRVPIRVREMLRIDVYSVDDDGAFSLIAD